MNGLCKWINSLEGVLEDKILSLNGEALELVQCKTWEGGIETPLLICATLQLLWLLPKTLPSRGHSKNNHWIF